MNLCGDTLRERNMFKEYFFSSDVENNLLWTQNEIPLFFTRSWEMTCFSIVQHNFHFHETSVWNCLFFKRLVLKLSNEWFYFFGIVMYGHYTHKQKRYK